MSDSTLLSRLPARASRPSADTLFRMGLSLCARGGSIAPDPVTAHALFEVAARLGSIEAKVYRRELSDEMDPADIVEAQQIARDWLIGG